MPVITLAVAVLATGCGTASASHAAAPSAAPHAAGPPRNAVQPHAGTAPRATGAAHANDAARATGAANVTGVPQASAQPGLVQAIRSSGTQIAHLPLATTYGSTPAAPQDPAPFGSETGTVVHPTTTRVIYARPGGPAVAALPATQLGSPTWVPVVQSQPGWDRVLLPTRPDRSTGWIYLGGGGLQTAYSPYQVDINLARYRLTILDAGRRLGTWTVAEGAPSTPTPVGRTFVLASLVPLQPTYSPLILPLGTHSDTLTTYGGGPGTVGLHGWPDSGVFGHAVSHGCVRVPAGALRALSLVPLGSAVMITG
ncbi:MAG: L,D-transpeptidase [Actinomycetota bacterium]|nr:L,D-transpeptidase [Actinomycetota bacterium]